MNLSVCIMVLLKFDLNVLLYLLIHSTLPGYFLFRWRRTALSLDSVLALQISWPLSSRSTSLRVDWKSESDSCHLLPMRCFFSMFSRESSILYGQQINIITFYLHTWSENSNRQITAYLLCLHLHLHLVIWQTLYPKRLTIGEYIKRLILKKQSDRGSARNTKSQALFK